MALGEDSENEKSTNNNNRGLVDVALRHAAAGRDSLLLARVIEEIKPDPAVALLDILYPYV